MKDPHRLALGAAACAALLAAPAAVRAQGPAPPPAAAMCAANPPIAESGSDWMSVGVDAASTRFQRKPGFSAAETPRLKLKWSFAMPGGGMPTVVGEWLFMTNLSGRFYALDTRTGCVRWFKDGVTSRTSPVIVRSPVSPSGWAVVTGERNRTIRIFDAQTGKGLVRSGALETHPAASITAAPLVLGGRIFAPITSGEEGAARNPAYPCCSFRGSLVALDASTAAVQWKTGTITEPLRPTRLNPAGTQMQGPAGGAIWSSPTADLGRGLVYVATGDSYTEVPTKGADAVIALEMQSGRVRWSRQVMENDNFVDGCSDLVTSANCPAPHSLDLDFGAPPILFRPRAGKDVLLAGQKSGLVYGLDPDTGRLLWTTRVGRGSEQGGVQWGMAADERRLYVANSDLVNLTDALFRQQGRVRRAQALPPGEPGLSALDPATGKVIWHTPAPDAPCHYADGRFTRDVCIRAQSAAVSVMPGVVFSGTMDGWFRAYDAATGRILWAYSTTAQTYETVNGVRDQPGGALNGQGAAIAGGMVFTMSGYNGGNFGGNGLNVLLAFSVDGR